ncbi:EamA family transporter [Massilia putida]|uniref:EamA family transporter n=1 Tax=Massilia putida TaxID=1141883 RepID=UPI000950EF22|nr:EamA family transporter [Massilia putida]
MERWIIYAFVSMAFAGFTSVIAKLGLAGISGDLGLTVRTCFVFVFMLCFASLTVPLQDLQLLTWRNVIWLGASAVTTTASWIFYYKAIKAGNVSTVALIDKGSVVIALALSYWILHEAITLPKMLGGLLIVTGLLVISRG